MAPALGVCGLIGYDLRHVTPVGRSENAGQTLVESNIVRSLIDVGNWYGSVLDLHDAVSAGDHMTVLVQAAGGRSLGAAREE